MWARTPPPCVGSTKILMINPYNLPPAEGVLRNVIILKFNVITMLFLSSKKIKIKILVQRCAFLNYDARRPFKVVRFFVRWERGSRIGRIICGIIIWWTITCCVFYFLAQISPYCSIVVMLIIICTRRTCAHSTARVSIVLQYCTTYSNRGTAMVGICGRSH